MQFGSLRLSCWTCSSATFHFCRTERLSLLPRGFLSFMTYGSCGVSLCTMTIISLDRFMALHYHTRYVAMVNSTRILCTLVTIWVIIFLSLSIFFWNIILNFFIAAVVIVICLSISSFFLLLITIITLQLQNTYITKLSICNTKLNQLSLC